MTTSAAPPGALPTSQARRKRRAGGYGRARLWVGVSGVGALVLVAAFGLAFDLPGRIDGLTPPDGSGGVLALAIFFGGYALLHLPFDFFGGFILPRRFGRAHPPLGAFIARLARGAAVQFALLLFVAVSLLVAGGVWGVVGVVVASSILVALLLGVRPLLARAMAPFRRDGHLPTAGVPTRFWTSDDEGFTGGIVGIVRARASVAPSHWRSVLAGDALATAMERRRLAIETGGWARGRLVAFAFTIAGVTIAALLTGEEALGAPAGVIELSLWFTLWSFLGLLVLPTFSRRGVQELDERLRETTPDKSRLEEAVRTLDGLQDDEPERPSFVEAIFHPIPSVNNRIERRERSRLPGCWDAARTAVYLSSAGLGLLGRAVHCNCGRPGLWVFLPTD